MVLLIVIVVLVVAFVATWGVRRHGESARADPDWHPTEERFFDPSTGRTMRVFVDEDGSRHYVAEP